MKIERTVYVVTKKSDDTMISNYSFNNMAYAEKKLRTVKIAAYIKVLKY